MNDDFKNINQFPDILVGYKQFANCMGGITEKTFHKWEKKYHIPISHGLGLPMIPRGEKIEMIPISPFSYSVKGKNESKKMMISKAKELIENLEKK